MRPTWPHLLTTYLEFLRKRFKFSLLSSLLITLSSALLLVQYHYHHNINNNNNSNKRWGTTYTKINKRNIMDIKHIHAIPVSMG